MTSFLEPLSLRLRVNITIREKVSFDNGDDRRDEKQGPISSFGALKGTRASC